MGFGIGSFVVFKFYWENDESFQKLALIESSVNTQVQVNSYSGEKQSLNKPNYVCEDKLIKPIWNKIIRDKSFQVYVEVREILDKKTIDCAEEFEVSNIDINDDGINELAIKAKWGRFCGMYSGCWFGIFKRNSDGFETAFTNGNTFYFNLGIEIKTGLS
ncbi:MAG: hypothetical protein LC778_18990 [Acidobacteria bacterium]|nr:hypothetical protein [Acidobacteriota bacterium]